jgi:glycosyltransferase involved in cell wall biosynthesis
MTLSVCIAAYNESRTIGRLLGQLAATTEDQVCEIIVCANGCTDNTESVVAEYSDRDSRIGLIFSPKGKPAAWNALMSTAKSDLRLFLDADVGLAPDFFRFIHDALRRHPDAAIIAARDIPKRNRNGFGPFLAALASRSFGFDYVCGRAYVLRLSAIPRGHVESEGTVSLAESGMPLQILHEDLWLEVSIGRSLIALAPVARIYYDPGTLNDLLKTRARLRVARRQVAALLPNRFVNWQRDFTRSGNVYARLRQRISTMDGTGDALACFIGTAARSILMIIRRSRIREIESQMHKQMARHGGHEVLAGSGRLAKD